MSSKRPTVSVIVNCYNGEKHLKEALDSVKAQTFADYEIIFWDNCSTDGSANIARAADSRLRYFHGDTNVPLGAARNLAIAKSQGKYIAFLDCDDLWRPEKLEKQVELFESNPKLGLVCTDTEIFNGRRVLYRIFAQSKPVRGNAWVELMTRQWISMSSAMLRKEALDSLLSQDSAESGQCWFDESLNVCEEADVFYRIAHDWEIDHVDEPLTVWRVHGNNTTFRKFAQFAKETRLILAKYGKLYPNFGKDNPELVKLLTGRAAFQEAVAEWRDGHGRQARKIIAPWLGNSRKNQLFWLASYLPGSFFDLAAKLYFALPTAIRRQG